jgi:bifunctional UDP-N-acetylglucosamine pyrophosphorylase / glucosamine-1-phosphate N-acetyltransferase
LLPHSLFFEIIRDLIMLNNSRIGVVILAAGDGTRMKSAVPKVMHELHGKPLVQHVVDNVNSSNCCEKPTVVVCSNHTLVQDSIGDDANYVIQEKQLGTGHAVAQAESLLKGKVDHVVVLYGDMPFLTGESIHRLVERHVERDNTITLMTFTVENFEGENKPFVGFSRVIRRDGDGHIAKDVQVKDASEDELNIKELNPCYLCFNAEWLWKHVGGLNTNNAQGEYYLTDLLRKAIDEGEKISSVTIEPKEAVGINTQDDLQVAASLT